MGVQSPPKEPLLLTCDREPGALNFGLVFDTLGVSLRMVQLNGHLQVLDCITGRIWISVYSYVRIVASSLVYSVR